MGGAVQPVTRLFLIFRGRVKKCCGFQIQNSKPEIQNNLKTRIQKYSNSAAPASFKASNLQFEFVSDFGFRASNLIASDTADEMHPFGISRAHAFFE